MASGPIANGGLSDHLKWNRKERDCIVALHENSGFPLRLFNIADILKIKAPTAYELVKRLESKNIIEKKNGVISLEIISIRM